VRLTDLTLLEGKETDGRHFQRLWRITKTFTGKRGVDLGEGESADRRELEIAIIARRAPTERQQSIQWREEIVEENIYVCGVPSHVMVAFKVAP